MFTQFYFTGRSFFVNPRICQKIPVFFYIFGKNYCRGDNMKRADNKNKGDPQETRETVASSHKEITPVNMVDTISDYPYPPQESEASKAPVEPESPSAPVPSEPVTPVNVTFPTAMAEESEKTNPKKNAKIIPESGTESSSNEREKNPPSDVKENAAEDVREWSKETKLS